MIRPRRWRNVPIGEARYTIEIAPYVTFHGATYHEEKRIVLRRPEDEAPGDWEDTLLHEIEHAIWEESGIRAVLREHLDETLADDLEERIVLASSTLRARALKALGWKPPKPRFKR